MPDTDRIEAATVIATHMLSAFATPVVNYRWPAMAELNAALENQILAAERADRGVTKSNVGGWHSGLDLLDWPGEAIAGFRQRLESLVLDLNRSVFDEGDLARAGDFTIDAWANVLRHGGYNSVHSHPNAFWSGVYYVTGNESLAGHPFSGKLELIDPRPGASLTYAEQTRLYGRFLVDPVAGQMVVFPAWLQHCVHPYFGSAERISVAFNVMFGGGGR